MLFCLQLEKCKEEKLIQFLRFFSQTSSILIWRIKWPSLDRPHAIIIKEELLLSETTTIMSFSQRTYKFSPRIPGSKRFFQRGTGGFHIEHLIQK